MKRPVIINVIRRDRRLTEAANRAIDAALGKSTRRTKAQRNLTAEVEQQFREAKHGST